MYEFKLKKCLRIFISIIMISSIMNGCSNNSNKKNITIDDVNTYLKKMVQVLS